MWWQKRKLEEDELAEEGRAHLAIEIQRRVDAGEDPEAAALAARRDFGSVAKIQEEARNTWAWTAFSQFLEDTRFGFRMLRKTPAWTAVICLTLALGIGLSTAIFSVVYGVLLRPLPYPDPERIVT